MDKCIDSPTVEDPYEDGSHVNKRIKLDHDESNSTESGSRDINVTPAEPTKSFQNFVEIDNFANEIKIEVEEGEVVEEKREKSKKEMEEEEREKMQVLVSNFTEGQLDRYEMFRRSAFPKAAIKRLMQTYTGSSVSQNAVIAMSGIAKVLVGEIVETALDAMEELHESGPIQPKHLRESVRRLRVEGKLSIGKPQQRFRI